MFKKFIYCLIVSIIISTISPLKSFAIDTFPDVPMSHLNYTAIQFLKDENVINGFSDGTFKPDLEVTRCEFLKIVMGASSVEPNDSSLQIFQDLPQNSWCNDYASKAKELGIVKGDEQGLFNPQKNISRIEALKLLYLIRGEDVGTTQISAYFDVPAESWYAPYIQKATYSNIISGKEPGRFGSSDPIKRSEMAEMMYRLLALEANNETVFNPNLTIPNNFLNSADIPDNSSGPDEIGINDITEAPLISFSNPVTALSGTIHYKFFDDITLDKSLPKTFILHEVYTISGKVKTSSQKVTIFITDESTNKQYTYYGEVDSAKHFSIPIDFKIAGSFTIGILPGTSGTSNVSDIVVTAEKYTGHNTIQKKADSLSISIQADGNSKFSWDNKDTTLSKIVFQQNDNQVVKIISNGINTYIPNYAEFKNFTEGNVGWAIFLANSSDDNAYNRNTVWSEASSTNIFQATYHNYILNDTNVLDLTNISIANNTGRFLLKGKSSEDIRDKIAIITNTGSVQEININTTNPIVHDPNLNLDVYKAPVNFEASLPFSSIGLYFIEINSSQGLAIYNAPIYIGNIFPLLPDFKDLEDSIDPVSKSQVENHISNLRNELLQLINKDRTRYHLSSVTLDTSLTNMAQAHANDMVLNNYFSHFNLAGKGPSVRKTSYNLGTPVGENLAKATTLIAIEEGLMRSAIHRANILRDDWERVGIGMAMDAENNLIVVQEFSNYPLNEQDLAEIETNLYQYINDKRISSNKSILTTNTLAHTIATKWSSSMINDDFFDFVNPTTSESLHTNIQNAGFEKSFSTLILSGGDFDSLSSSLDGSQNIYSQDRWAQVAIGLSNSENSSEINATVIFLET